MKTNCHSTLVPVATKRCSICKDEKSSCWNKKNARHHKDKRLRYLYGISIMTYEEMQAQQGGVCAICGKACVTGQSLAVDHCHETRTVRGLLCVNCNRGLGLFKDNEDALIRAASYLAKARVNG